MSGMTPILISAAKITRVNSGGPNPEFSHSMESSLWVVYVAHYTQVIHLIR